MLKNYRKTLRFRGKFRLSQQGNINSLCMEVCTVIYIKIEGQFINLDKKEMDTLILCIRHFKEDAYRYKAKTGDNSYFIDACRLLALFTDK